MKAAKKEGAAARRKGVMRALHQLHRRPAACRRHAPGECMQAVSMRRAACALIPSPVVQPCATCSTASNGGYSRHATREGGTAAAVMEEAAQGWWGSGGGQ